jgi:chitinase
VPTAVAAPSGLVSWWTGNNTAADAMGLNNATLLNGVTYGTAEVGKGFNFDGVNDNAALGDPDSLKFNASMTIEGWILVRAYTTTQNFGTIIWRGDDRGGLDPYSLVVLPNGTMRFEVDGGHGAADLLAPVPLGQLIHVAATLDDPTGAMTLYINGAVVAHQITTIRPFRDLDPTLHPGIFIGGGHNGLIDELSVYNRALTPGEVLGIYKAGSSGKVLSPIAVDFPSVIEGATGTTRPATFTITRTGSLSGSLTVAWATADDTATAGSDYVAASGSVTFASGEATKTVQVTVNGDNTPEADEYFKLILTPAGGTSIMSLATIRTDDASISVGDDAATEGSTAIRTLGALVPTGLGGLRAPYAMIVGPDGNYYVSSIDGAAVYRYDRGGSPLPAPGQSGATFVTPGSGGLSLARDLAFGPDGALYVVSQGSNAVLRYDPTYGTPAGVSGQPGDAVFIPGGSGGLSAPRGLTFHTDASGHAYAYVTSVGPDNTPAPGTDSVLRFDAATGAPAGVSGLPGDAVFIASGSGGLDNPSRIVFGPDGMAYVTSTAATGNSATTNSVLRYDPLTGAPAGKSAQPGDAVFVAPGSGGLDGPVAMVFRPDGYLYVVGFRSNSVNRYLASDGTFFDQVVPPGTGGLSSPIDLLFDAGGNLLVTSKLTNQVLRYGAASELAFTVSLASASAATTTVSYSTADGTALAGRDYAATSGTLTFAPGETAKAVLVSTLDDGLADPTRSFTLNLSSPTNGVITDSQGVGAILDDTKFYVVNDGGSDQTYQYASGGAALGNNALAAGDTAPRGVATTAAGTTEWVVDANKNVYV